MTIFTIKAVFFYWQLHIHFSKVVYSFNFPIDYIYNQSCIFSLTTTFTFFPLLFKLTIFSLTIFTIKPEFSLLQLHICFSHLYLCLQFFHWLYLQLKLYFPMWQLYLQAHDQLHSPWFLPIDHYSFTKWQMQLQSHSALLPHWQVHLTTMFTIWAPLYHLQLFWCCYWQICLQSMLNFAVDNLSNSMPHKAFIFQKSESTVNVLNFRTLVACQKGLAKQHRPWSDCFWRSSLIKVFPVCYSDNQFVTFISYNQHFIWE